MRSAAMAFTFILLLLLAAGMAAVFRGVSVSETHAVPHSRIRR
jgi:hypothetical protein